MSRNPSITQKFKIKTDQGTVKGYLHMTNREDGTLLGIELDMYKDGTTSRAMAHAFTAAFNKGLASGIPMKDFIDEFKGWRFPPFGEVEGSPNVSECTSILDYVVKELDATYMKPHEA